MPIYEYRCEACGEELEKLQRISDDPFRDCPACGRSSLRRLVSAAGFRLKGSGWYETDFKRDNRRNVVESGAGKPGGEAAATTQAEAGSEAKPAAVKDSGKTADSGPKSPAT